MAQQVYDVLVLANKAPLEVQPIKTKRGVHLYAIDFAKGVVTFDELAAQFKVINYHGLKWEMIKKDDTKRTNALCCKRCAMPTHGATGCIRNPVCIKCACAHMLRECTEQFLRCCHCARRNFPNQNHRADDKNCPIRIAAAEFRANGFKPKAAGDNVAPAQMPAPAMQQSQPASGVNSIPFASIVKDVQQPIAANSAAHTFTPPGPIAQLERRPPAAPAVASSAQRDNSPMPLNTIFAVMSACIEGMRACRTKNEQLLFMANFLAENLVEE